jgi:lipoprotein signal peptidase
MEKADKLYAAAMAETIAEVVLDAYTKRFPKFNMLDRCIMINSLYLVVGTYLTNISEEEREFTIDMLVNGWRKIKDPISD